MRNKTDVVAELVEAHFNAEPHLVAVWRIVAANEDAATEPIKLLEVNAATVAMGSVTPFWFSPTQEVPFPTVVAEITPEELESVKQDPSKLPEGWSLKSARRYSRNDGQ